MNIGKYLFTARGRLRKELKERKHETAAALDFLKFYFSVIMQSGVPLAAEAMKYIFLVLCRVLPVTKDVLAAAIILCKDNHGAGDTLQPIREHQLW